MDGFLIETGPDSFVSYRPAGIELCRELGLEGSIVGPNEPRSVHVRSGRRFVRLPKGMGLVLPTRIGPFITTPMFSPAEKLRMGLDLLLPRDRNRGDIGVGPFLRRRFGDALVRRLAGPLIGGVYGTPIDTLSLDAVVPQLREAERAHRSILLASLAQGRARQADSGAKTSVSGTGEGTAAPRHPRSVFVTLSGGTGQLTNALVAALDASSSVKVRRQTRVGGMERERRGGGIAVLLDHGERLHPEAVVLATPAPATASILDEVAPTASRCLRTIPYGSTAVVSLAFRVDQFREPLVGHGFLVADGESLAISACT